jgi:hypothetical protein
MMQLAQGGAGIFAWLWQNGRANMAEAYCGADLFRTLYANFGFNAMEYNMTRWFWLLAAVLGLSGCGYNDFQRLDEQTKSAWSEVLNQYQRRADLVPNIVATVKGEAAFEQDTLTRVIEARAKATSIQVTPETLNDPAVFQKFQAAQGELGSALSRLMVVSEQTHQPKGHSPPHPAVSQTPRTKDCQLPQRAYFLVKSTTGGALMAASFATVNAGLGW